MDHNDSLWVDRRLDSLQPPAGWQPDSAAAHERFRRLHRAASAGRKRRIWLGLAAVAACLTVAVWLPRPSPPAIDTPGAVPSRVTPARVSAGFRETGSADAPLLAEIYSDYQCGHCAVLFLETVPQLITDYVQTGKLRLLHRDLPLPQHLYSRDAARWANAAGRIGRYDLVVDRLFRSQGAWGADGDIESRLSDVLAPAEMARIRETIRNHADLDTSIDADLEMARSDEVRQTPTMIVVSGGRRRSLAPVPPYPLLKGYLDELLKANCREDPHAARC